MSERNETDGDAAERRDDLARQAREHADAVWGDESPEGGRRRRAPLLSLEVGPKNRMSAELRELSRRSGREGDQVPFGTTSPGGGRYIALTMLLVIGMASGLLALLWWLVS